MIGNFLSVVCALVISCVILSTDAIKENDQQNLGSPEGLTRRGENNNLGEKQKWVQTVIPRVLARSGRNHRKRKDFREIKELINRSSKQLDNDKYISSDLQVTRFGSRGESQDEPSIIYLGCVATWEEQRTYLTVADISKRIDNEYTPQSCVKKCQISGELNQLAFLKGGSCYCAQIYAFKSKWIDNSYCNLPCPYSEFIKDPTNKVEGDTCGGNLGYSVYCAEPGRNRCNEIIKPMLQKSDSDVALAPRFINWGVNDMCTFCGHLEHEVCKKPYIIADFDYFPANSPEDCIRYCSASQIYVGNKAEKRIRVATPYAVLTFWRDGIANLPICRCLPESDRSIFTTVPKESNTCGAACPGDPDSTCGGLESLFDGMFGTFATIYCTSSNKHCSNYVSPNDTESSTAADTELPITPPDSTTEDICNSGDFDCEQDNEPTPEPTTTTSRSTSTTTTEISNPTIATPLSTSTTEKTSSIVTIRTSHTTTSSTTTELPCENSCIQSDSFGYTWRGCANTYVRIPCSLLANNASGDAWWRCGDNGKFSTPFPNVYSCHSPWVKERMDKIEEIKSIESAKSYMNQLEEDCRNAQNLTSDIKYFGHDITNIASIVDLVFKRIPHLGKDSGTFSTFQKMAEIVENAVNINALLIRYREPWHYLNHTDKSITSTNVLKSTEAVLFNLTNEFTGQNFSKMFSLKNESRKTKFLILAETFKKDEENKPRANYEFPPRHSRIQQDSYIKLPLEWKSCVSKEKVEIAAMSIDPKFVSYIMPGQFAIASSTELEGVHDYTSKLMNSKLISLSLSSPSNGNTVAGNPMVSFKGKGAEIIFYHDIEAWGEEKQKVPRKLHYDEKPRAVLGTTQCVFWDTKELSWSSTGCHIVKSDRFKTVCECSHLTSFAVLMDVHNYVGKQAGLQILTLVLCPLSEIALFLSIVILSSVHNLQKIRTTITRNLAGCLLVGNAMVLIVLDRNYFNMSESLCIGAGMLTHYVFLCAFMWMLIEGIQLYRMVVNVFDSGKSYLKHFAIFAYGSPLLAVSITATTGYLQGDKPYGGDVYCWLEGTYIWSFMAPVAIVIMINFVILFIALKTAYQVKQSKKHSPSFFQGKIRSYKTWLKGCFSLTCILGLTWVLGFFTLMRGPSGLIAAYLFTIFNSSQGIFIFIFNCVLNEKVRTLTKRNLSTYLPPWLSSSLSSSSTRCKNDESVGSGKRPSSPGKTDASALSEKSRKRLSKETSSPVTLPKSSYIIPKAKLIPDDKITTQSTNRLSHRIQKVDFDKTIHVYSVRNDVQKRNGSVATISSVESIPNSTSSENGHMSSDTSQSGLISVLRSKFT